MSDSIIIDAINLIGDEPFKNGEKPLALFDCQIRGFWFCGCILLRSPSNRYMAQLPRVRNRYGSPYPIRIIEAGLRVKIIDAATEAYLKCIGSQQ